MIYPFRDASYKKALTCALSFHLLLVLLLVTDTSTNRPTLVAEHKNNPGMELPVASVPKQEAVKAVSVDNKEIMDTVNRLKQEREQQKRAELNRQKELQHQAELAKQERIKEQQHIAKLKQEADRIAIARKKQAEEEQKRLTELAKQKELETKRIEELKKQQEQLVKQKALEAKKLADLNKKREEEKKQAQKLLAEKALAEKALAEKALAEKALAEKKAIADAKAAAEAKAALERKKQADAQSAQRALAQAEAQARIAGEVDKYKALIVGAIGQHWILPENVNSSLSSQFRIRLAPDGTVLDVNLTRSSGDPLLDRSAQTAIFKASPLPVPKDAETFNLFRDISLTVRPEQVRG